VAPAHADTCDALAGKTQCLKFRFSSGGDKSSTTIFNADGTFTLPDATGTCKCAGGLGLFEANYKDSAGEKQRWYATAGSGGNHVSGNGKSLTLGYSAARRPHGPNFSVKLPCCKAPVLVASTV